MTALAAKLIKDALKKMGVEAPDIEVQVPKEPAHGDLSTPVAMGLAKTLKKPPRKIAEDIIANFAETEKYFSKVEIAGAGFINFTFRPEFIYQSLKELLTEKEKFLRRDIGQGKRILIEFVSANPTGPLHLGHGRGAAVGAALSNLLSAAGFNVVKEFYINDAGKQVLLLGESVFARYKNLLGVDYPFPEEGYRGDYVAGIAKEILTESGDKYKDASLSHAIEFFRDYACRKMLSLIKEDLEAFGVTFDSWQSESELYEKGVVRDTIEFLKSKGYAYEKEGALWFNSQRFGDEKDRVLVKSDGEYTYFAPDIAYHKKKADGGYDELINIWGADHHGYIARMKAALEALGYGKERLTVLLVQIVSLLRGGVPVQMSKRAGEFVTLKEVMDEVGADTTKFIFLTRRPDSHLDFDLEVAKAQSAENPVFYIQYAFARINSIFKEAVKRGIEPGGYGTADLSLLQEPEETAIIKKMLLYPMAFEAAARAREPHRITYYLQELAGMFHPYYNRHKVLGEDAALTKARLALMECIALLLKEGLKTLGVHAPERM
jgi:arginyl-tRNA synthetase